MIFNDHGRLVAGIDLGLTLVGAGTVKLAAGRSRWLAAPEAGAGLWLLSGTGVAAAATTAAVLYTGFLVVRPRWAANGRRTCACFGSESRNDGRALAVAALSAASAVALAVTAVTSSTGLPPWTGLVGVLYLLAAGASLALRRRTAPPPAG